MKITFSSKNKIRHVPFDFEYEGESYKGEGVPLSQTCDENAYWELEITLNSENLGKIQCTKRGWKMDYVKDEGLVNKIGELITLWYE
jgi:hypothetical protein